MVSHVGAGVGIWRPKSSPDSATNLLCDCRQVYLPHGPHPLHVCLVYVDQAYSEDF